MVNKAIIVRSKVHGKSHLCRRPHRAAFRHLPGILSCQVFLKDRDPRSSRGWLRKAYPGKDLEGAIPGIISGQHTMVSI